MSRRIDWTKLIILLLITAGVFIFWNAWFIYPFKIFTVYMHELSHGIAAQATGGRLDNITISPDIGGVAAMTGGNMFFVYNAGYLGSLIIGGLLLLFSQCKSKRVDINKIILAVLAMAFIVITLMYVKNLFGIIIAILFAVTLIIIMMFVPESIRKYFLMIMGLTSCIYALYDILFDILILGAKHSDAAKLAVMTGIPLFMWGLLWMMFAAFCVIIFIWIAISEKKSSEY